MIVNSIKFLATAIQPKPEEIDYWVDIKEDPYGTVIKIWDGFEWKKIDLKLIDGIIGINIRLAKLEEGLSGCIEDLEEYKKSNDERVQRIFEIITNHINNKNNPHEVTKELVGLGNVTNDAQVKRSEMGVANGVATLDSHGIINVNLLPSYVDDVIEGIWVSDTEFHENGLPVELMTGVIYVDVSTNKSYRYTGTILIEITSGPMYTDEEDLHKASNGKLSFADKQYNEELFSGLGRVYLRKNIVYGKNVLTLEMINQPNTIYHIQYNYDFNGQTINIPSNCVLYFDGGSFENGALNGGSNTKISSNKTKIFTNVKISGVFINEWFVEYFGANNIREDNQIPINEAITQLSNLKGGGTLILSSQYVINDTVYIRPRVNIIGRRNDSFLSSGSPNKDIPRIGLYMKSANSYQKWIIDTIFEEEKTIPPTSCETGGVNLRKRIAGNKFGGFDIYSDKDYPTFGGIRIINALGISVENVDIWGCSVGMYMSIGWWNKLSNIKMEVYRVGFYFGENSTYFECSNTSVQFCTNPISLINVPNLEYKHRDNLFPPYVEVDKIGVIAEGVANSDKTNIMFRNSSFEHLDCICVGYRCDILFDKPYIENRNKWKTIVWCYDGDVRFPNGYVGGFTSCELDSYEFGAKKSNIYVSGFPSCRCYDGYLKTDKESDYTQYRIEYNDKLCYYDKIKLDESGLLISGEVNPQKKIINWDNKFRTTHENMPSLYGEIYNTTNVGYKKVTIDEIIKRSSSLEAYLNIELYNISAITTDDVITNKLVNITKLRLINDMYIQDFRLYGKPIKINNCIIKSPGFALMKNNPYLFEVTGGNNKIYMNNSYIESSAESFKALIKLTGNEDVNIYIYDLISYFQQDKIIDTTEFKGKYNIYCYFNNNTYKLYTNRLDEFKSSGTFAQKPTIKQGIPIGINYFCTDKQTTEGAANGIMIYHRGNDVWVDALGRTIN